MYGRAYDTVPAMNCELPREGEGLVPLLEEAVEKLSCDGALDVEPDSGLLAGVSGVKETPDCRMSSSLIKISDCPLRKL